MKKLLVLLFLFSFLASCGPHRMRCGARGICDTANNNVNQSKV